MSESENKSNDHNSAVPPSRQKYRLQLLIGWFLWLFGVVFTTNVTMNHLKQQPRVPLGFDLTLRSGYGGFIAYGVATAVLGFILGWMASRRRKAK